MTIGINKGERLLLLSILDGIERVDRTVGRIVLRIQDRFRLLDSDLTQVTIEETQDEIEVELESLEAEWVLDSIERLFNEGQMPRRLAEFGFSLEEKLQTFLNK